VTAIGLIGFGEVGSIFARDLMAKGAGVRAYDIRPVSAPDGVVLCASAVEATAGCAAVFIAVTAGSTLDATCSLAGGLAHGPLVIDVNSVAPAAKREASAIVEAYGGRYVEAAVMSSVPPKGLATPMLLGGPHAKATIDLMAPFGMNLKVYAEEIGGASSVKMCRSVLIKGLEALLTESMLAARHYGVEKDVLASLGDTLPHPDWEKQARYMISRALLHGRRRAEEMREVARTVEAAGITPLLSSAIAQRQDWAADQTIKRPDEELGVLLDAVLARIEHEET
jgi:3-hydroxyisobutyrate dehydrogenase-like beta-hydroxyacid dehydrogenase